MSFINEAFFLLWKWNSIIKITCVFVNCVFNDFKSKPLSQALSSLMKSLAMNAIMEYTNQYIQAYYWASVY